MTDIRPSLPEFCALAREYTVVPVWREVLADLETPVSAFLKLVGDGEGFLLESVEHGQHWGRYSFIGRDPVVTLAWAAEAARLVGLSSQGAVGATLSVVPSAAHALPYDDPAAFAALIDTFVERVYRANRPR